VTLFFKREKEGNEKGSALKANISHNFPEVVAALRSQAAGGRRAVREAINRTADWAETDVRRELPKVFDRPIPYTLRALLVRYASTANLEAELWFKRRSADADKLWAAAQVAGGSRAMKPMELRLQRAGILPHGWMVVPGGAMPLDAYGNISRGEVSRILNVLGTYTEAGYNKANDKTRARLRKGNAKRGVYGFAYWVNPIVGPRRQRHLQPGVYRRVYTPFGTSLRPMLIFVNRAMYRVRLPLGEIVQRTVQRRFPGEFEKAMHSVLTTGSASGARVARGAYQPRVVGLREVFFPRGGS
jgi:hypothetical protein